MESRKRRKYSRIYCRHCELHVCKSTWYIHHCQYYDSVKGQWTKDSHTSQDNTEPDFNFESSDEDGKPDVAEDNSLANDGSEYDGFEFSDVSDEKLVSDSYLIV